MIHLKKLTITDTYRKKTLPNAMVMFGNVLISLNFHLVILMAKLTKKQKDFVSYHVRDGINPTASARLAGYGNPKQSGFDLVKRSPSVMAEIQQQRIKYFHTDLATVATDTLRQVMESPDSPASAKVSACRTVLEVCSLLGKHSTSNDSQKDLSAMNPAELSAVIAKLEDSKLSMAKVIKEEVKGNQ